MRLFLTIAFVFAFGREGYSCKCTFRDLKTELQLSEEIIVGQLISIKENELEVKVLKAWKSNVKVDTLRILIDPNDGCYRRTLFPLNEYFVIFLESGRIHNCSRTMEYIKSPDIKLLDSIFSKTLWVHEKDTATLSRLEYTRQFIIHTDKGEIDIKDKKVVFNFEGKIIPREDLPAEYNSFYPVRYFLVATNDSIENNPCNIDFIFYVNQAHQDMILLETRKKKIEKKSLRSACH